MDYLFDAEEGIIYFMDAEGLNYWYQCKGMQSEAIKQWKMLTTKYSKQQQ